MECVTCGKKILNTHLLDGKVYGYNCYKLALALKYVALQGIKNDDWVRKCVAAIETFQNMKFKDSWNENFQVSILAQWNECGKLTGKQMEAIVKKFDEIEHMKYQLLYLELSEYNKEIARGIENNIRRMFMYFANNAMAEIFKNDERVHAAIKLISKRVKLIVKYKDIDESCFSYGLLEQQNELDQLRNDEYIEIIEVIEI